jgi:hypothetical protein
MRRTGAQENVKRVAAHFPSEHFFQLFEILGFCEIIDST